MIRDFLYVKITVLYVISTFEMYQYDIKNMSLKHGSFSCLYISILHLSEVACVILFGKDLHNEIKEIYYMSYIPRCVLN